MSFNFFQNACQELPMDYWEFGLCDDQIREKAYTDITDREKWIATVKNGRKVILTFTAIDKCVIKDNEAPKRGRCDGMLTSEEHLYFIELKNKSKDWVQEAIEQLESTIKFFIANHDHNIFKHKKAFACNKKHQYFQEVSNELNLRFFRTYRFRIDVHAEILVI